MFFGVSPKYQLNSCFYYSLGKSVGAAWKTLLNIKFSRIFQTAGSVFLKIMFAVALFPPLLYGGSSFCKRHRRHERRTHHTHHLHHPLHLNNHRHPRNHSMALLGTHQQKSTSQTTMQPLNNYKMKMTTTTRTMTMLMTMYNLQRPTLTLHSLHQITTSHPQHQIHLNAA